MFLVMLAMTAAPGTIDPCSGSDTVSVNECLAGKVERAEQRLADYRAAARKRFGGTAADPAISKGLDDAAAAGDAYRKLFCDTVYQQWSGGTIRNAMALACNLVIVDRQTHELWQNFLTYADSTPPILPEPKPTR